MTEVASNPGRDTLAERYFGPDAGVGGPFALLGVIHDCGGPADINRALERRLTQLGRHRQALTPDADELRLSLYTAAAQLSDPKVRDACAEIWPPGEPHAMPAAWRAHLAAVSPVLVRRARHIIGVSGGWNSRAKKRLAMMARSQRVSAVDLVGALRPKRPSPAGVGTGVLSPPGPELREPRMSGRDWFLIHAGLMLMLVLMVGLSVRELVRPPQQQQLLAANDLGSTQQHRAPRAAAPPERSDVRHHAALEQELTNAIAATPADPAEGGRRVARVAAEFLSGWTAAPSDARDRIAGKFKSFVLTHRGTPAAVHPMLAVMGDARTLEDPRAYAASAGLGVLIGPVIERSDPTQDAFADAIPPLGNDKSHIDAVLLAALDSLGGIVTDPGADWWEIWASCVERCTAAGVDDREDVLLKNLGRGLAGSAESGWRETARSIASRVSWRSGSAARSWLLERFGDDGVRSDRLAELTRVLATEISVPGVDLTMVLAPDASSTDRQGLAERYRGAWLAERAPPTEAQARVLDAIKSAIELADRTADRSGRLVVIEQLVRANAAAGLLFAGDQTAPDRLLSDSSDTGPSGVKPASNQTLDTDWAVRLMRADTETGIMRVLGEAGGRDVGAQAAEALVTVAFTGPGRRVRDRARDMLRIRAGSASVLLAMERAMDGRVSSAELDLALELLGWPEDSADTDEPEAVRAALLMAAAEQSLDTGIGPGVTGLRIQEALAERAGFDSDTPGAISLAELVARWSPGGSAASSAERRLGAMLAVSGSTGQMQAAYHRALAELVGLGLVRRGRVSGPWAERVLDRMNKDWAGGATATDQMLSSQLAEARLWELALEGTP